MTRLDPGLIRGALGEPAAATLAELESFAEIESTNSYLMRKAGPAAGRCRVAVTDNQTAGRGRHGKTWQSPPGSGLCLSMAYTFARSPENLPALTLAIGLGAVESLAKMDIRGVQVKWPNDLVAMDGKMGGILTETQAGKAMTVVTGVGINLDLTEPLALLEDADRALRVVDVRSHAGRVPPAEALAAGLIDGLQQTFANYEQKGFAAFVDRWADHDWLYGRKIAIDAPERQLAGTAAGIAADGALLLETASGMTKRITSGSVVMAATAES